MNYLLDTCVISELSKPRPNPAFLAWLETIPEERLFLSVITLGELQKGVSALGAGARSRALQHWLDVEIRRRFADRLLDLDAEILLCWGKMAGEAERRGRPLPVIDGLLAATAKSRQLVFVTRDIGHLPESGLDALNPWA